MVSQSVVICSGDVTWNVAKFWSGPTADAGLGQNAMLRRPSGVLAVTRQPSPMPGTVSPLVQLLLPLIGSPLSVPDGTA